MKAVNLIPAEERRASSFTALPSLGPSHALIGVLGVAVIFAVLYVTSGNTIAQRQAQLASAQSALAHEQARVTGLSRYVQFEQLAQQRVSTVREIAQTRFDWQSTMNDLSHVIPANTSLQSLTGTDSPSDSAAGGSGSGGSAGSLRSYGSGPSVELSGCTGSQDDVARLISRLRLMNGVTRVTLSDSAKNDSGAASTAGAAGGTTAGCGPRSTNFDLIVFYSPVAGASALTGGTAGTPAAATPAGSTPTTTTTSTTSAAPTTTTTSAPSTGTAATTPPPTTTTGSGSTPASSSGGTP